MPYDATDKSAKLALSFGEAAVHNGNGKLIRHEAAAVGSDLQVKLQSALGLADWQSCEKLTYDGADIPSQNFEFYGGGAAAGQSALFPNDVAHPGAAMINVNLPIGMAQDDQPDKLVGRYKTSKTADYTAAGVQTDFNYSPNPARAAVHGIKLLTGGTSLVEFGSFDEYKAWCSETLSIQKDGATIQIARFYLNAFFIPPFTLKQLLDRICALSCSDWQWRRGKIRFIPAANRAPVFDFDLSQVAQDFTFQSLPKKSRPNGIRVLWRDYDNALLKEADPIVVKRQNLIDADGGIENFYEFNAGVCNKSQAERTAHYLARLKCDLLDFALIRGSYKSYIVLPGDMVTLSHTTPEWTSKLCKVIKKVEDEDKGTGYEHYLQMQPANPYSDADQTALSTRAAAAGLNPYGAPPAPALELEEQLLIVNDGTVRSSILGTAVFGAFGFNQTGKVYWLKPSAASYELLTELTPDANNQATFRVFNLATGTHWFKVVAVSGLGVAQSGVGAGEQSITIDDSAYGFRGRDTARVPLSAITAQIIKSVVFDNGENVDVNVAGEVVAAKIDPAAQGDSINQSRVEMFNKFGESVIRFVPDGFTGAGTLGKGTTSRKYADPIEEGYFRIQVRNYWGWSQNKYLKGAVLSDNEPAKLLRANCPLELTAAAVSAATVRVSYQFSSAVSLYRRKVGQGAADWVLHASGIAASPYDAASFPEYTEYELQLRSDAVAANRSNIVRIFTKPQGETPSARPAPTGISGAPNSSSPQTQLDFSCVSAANVQTEVFVGGVLATTLAAVAVGGTVSYSITGLSAGTARAVKFRHKWATNDYSVFTEEITRSTNNAAAVASPPTIDDIYYNDAAQQVEILFTPHGGAGNYTISRKISLSGAYQILTSSHSGSLTSFPDAVSQTRFTKHYYYKISRNDVSGESSEADVIIPPSDTDIPYV